MEARILFAADVLHVGAVYVEQDLGSDIHGDRFEITFNGGAEGTQLSRVTIDGDQNDEGLSLADAIFDTVIGGLGADGGIGLEVISQEGIDDVTWHVDDGASQLILDFTGFDAGDKLVFSIDVDEIQDYEEGMTVAEINDGIDPITSGIEFQGSQLIAEFQADHYYDATAEAEFRNRYDENFAGHGLDLPADDHDGKRDRTAGAVDEVQQVPLPASIKGRVQLSSANGDCFGDREDHEAVAGVTVELLDANGDVIATTTTDANGDYSFENLLPGSYGVREIQPAHLIDGAENPGLLDGRPAGEISTNDTITSIDLLGGQSAVDLTFCEHVPASIQGRVQLSTAGGDCFGDSEDHGPVPDVVVELLDESGKVIATTVTDANGEYSFGDLAPGKYSVREIQPEDLIDGSENPGRNGDGPAGEVSGDDLITSIDLTGGEMATDVSFCEHQPASLAGNVYHDRENDGRRDADNEGIAGVTVQLLDEAGKLVAEATTDAEGRYKFDDLSAGSYTLHETHPSGWIDGVDTAGTVAGLVVGVATNPGDEIDEVILKWGDRGEEYNFGEFLGAKISGRVQLSTREGDCFGEDAEHDPVVGAVIQLYDANGDLVAETTTDSNGEYHFEGLPPGDYSLVEITPEDLIDGGANAGVVDGEHRGNVVNGSIRDISLGSGESAEGFDFCEHKPATIGGYVYEDDDDDGNRDSGEGPIEGVEIILYDNQGNVVARTTTDENGHYQFDGLSPGIYSIQEVHPDDYIDGKDTPGQINGGTSGTADNPGDRIQQIEIGWGDEGVEFNFGELIPATLRGIVHTDVGTRDCEFNVESGDELLSGVTIQLINASGEVIAETTTDAQGRYEFTNVAPGEYSIREIQPDGYFNGSQVAPEGKGDTKGTNVITNINVGAGEVIEELNFCEDPPVTLSGYVFKDGEDILLRPGETLPERIGDIRDGVRSDDDTHLSGVVVVLGDGLTGVPISHDRVLPDIYPEGQIQAVTDENGHYEFVGLLAGPYSVYERQPVELTDGVDTAGSHQGFVFNPGEPVSESVFVTLEVHPENDAIVRIILRPGDFSIENNFSEVAVQHHDPKVPPPILPPPPIDPPPPPPVIEYQVDNLLPDPAKRRVKDFGHLASVVPDFTWHLSVVDAGQPRGEGLSNVLEPEPVWFASTYMPAHHNAGRYLVNGQWFFQRGADGTPIRETSCFGGSGGIPVAGDFNGDGLFEMAVFVNGDWFIDINGNGMWDSADLWAKLGHHRQLDLPVSGDWDGDGKDDIGIFGPAWRGDQRAVSLEPGLPDNQNPPNGRKKNIPPTVAEATDGQRVMKLSNKGRLRADVIDHVFHYGVEGDFPVVGDWNGDGIQAIGIFRQGRWNLDMDGNGRWTEVDDVADYGQKGDIPVVGDFNGDGVDEIGFFRNGKFYLDTNGNRQLDETDHVIELGRAGDFPVAGDFDGDGKDDVAVYRATEPPEEPVERPAESVARKAAG